MAYKLLHSSRYKPRSRKRQSVQAFAAVHDIVVVGIRKVERSWYTQSELITAKKLLMFGNGVEPQTRRKKL